MSKITLILISIALFVKCSATKTISEEEYLLHKVSITVNNSPENKDELVNLLYQKPNGKILGIPLRLMLYNMAKPTPQASYDQWLDQNPNSQKFLTKWLSAKQVDRLGSSFLVSGYSNLLKNIGQPPTIFSQDRTEKSMLKLKNYYFNQGYFNTKVTTLVDTTSKDKKAEVFYNISTGNAFLLDSITSVVHSEALRDLYKKTENRSLLSKGNKYNSLVLDQERERITSFFRNNGAYDFQKTYINYDVDTLKQNNTVDITIVIDNKTIKSGDTLVKEPFKLYKISKVNIHTSNPKDENQTLDTLKYKGIYIYSKGKLNYRPKTLANATFIEANGMYSDIRKTLTTRSFSNLNEFTYPAIEYTKDPKDSLGNTLIANINIIPKARANFNPRIDFLHSNIQQMGIEGAVSTSFRNIFKGAETLDIGVRGNIGASASKYRSNENKFFDILEYGADVKLRFPKFLFFTNTDRIIPRRMFPITTLSIGLSSQRNIGLDKQNLTSAFNYNWSPERRNNFSFDLLNLQFVRNMNPDNYFNVYRSSYYTLNQIASETNTNPDYLDANGNLTIAQGGTDAFINDVLNLNTNLSPTENNYRLVSNIAERKKRLTENNLILASSITFTHSTKFNLQDKNFYTLKTKVESAGNIMNLLAKANNTQAREDGKKTILDVAYSQYIKTEIDYVKYFELTPQQTIAIRAFGGIAIPYGNSNNIPFSKSYFAGGTNDNRAWQSYRLGPGRSTSFNDFNEANMKLAFNAEYRFNVSGPWNLALFTDMGNIWNALDNTEDESMKFNGWTSLKDIAIGSGIGIRYDFNFFIIRLDLGFKTYNPAKESGNKWFREWNLSKTVLNVGINYPF